MAEWYEYIKIRGAAPEFETQVFQGIAGGGTSSGDTSGLETVLTEMRDYLERISAALWQDDAQTDAFSLALWNAQSTAIGNENAYLDQLDSLFKDKQRVLTAKQSTVVDFFQEMLESTVSIAVTKWLTAKLLAAGVASGPVGIIAVVGAFLAEFGISQAFDKLGKLLKEGNKMVAAMQAENEALLDVTSEERTASLYDKRAAVMDRHLQQIQIILKQIDDADKDVKEVTKLTNYSTEALENILKQAFLVPKMVDGDVVTDDEGNTVYEGFLDGRLEDLAYNEDSFRVGDVEINTRGRYVKH